MLRGVTERYERTSAASRTGGSRAPEYEAPVVALLETRNTTSSSTGWKIVAHVLLTGERNYEVPITYKARSREESKKLTALDGLRVLRTLSAAV